jgi:hypothetical protein
MVDAVVRCYSGALKKRKFNESYKTVTWDEVKQVIDAIKEQEQILKAAGWRPFAFETRNFSLLRAAETAVGSVGSGGKKWCPEEARWALLNTKKCGGMLTDKQASEQSGVAEDTFRHWRKQLSKKVDGRRCDAVDADELRAAAVELSIGSVGRPPTLLPHETIAMVGVLTQESARRAGEHGLPRHQRAGDQQGTQRIFRRAAQGRA